MNKLLNRLLVATFVFSLATPAFAVFDCIVWFYGGGVSGYSADTDSLSEAIETGERIIQNSGKSGGTIYCRQIR